MRAVARLQDAAIAARAVLRRDAARPAPPQIHHRQARPVVHLHLDHRKQPNAFLYPCAALRRLGLALPELLDAALARAALQLQRGWPF
jgi:hypothetical protein